MTSTAKFSCVIDTTNPECQLGMEIWLDNDSIFKQNHVRNQIFFEHNIDDVESEHSLRFVMSGKTSEHTKIDQNGEILSDARLIINEVSFDEISLGQVFVEKAVYQHNFNGHGDLTQEKFYEEMGCNGTVELKFSTPIYLWILENL